MNQNLNEFENAVDALIEQGNIDTALAAIRALVESVINDPATSGTVLRSPTLDHICARIGRFTLDYMRREKIQPPIAEMQADVIFLATELHSIGGHSRVVADIIRARPDKRHLILLTDFFDSDYEMDLTRYASLNVEVRRSKSGNYADKLLWAQMQLSAHPNAQVLLFNHHADASVIAAIQPGLNKDIVFCHHADHNLCLGAGLSTTRHVDLFDAFCHDCTAAGLKAELWPLSVPDTGVRPHDVTSFQIGEALVTCTSAHEAKFLAPYPFHYWDVLPLILQASKGEHVHIGYLSADVLEAIYEGLKNHGVPSTRFKHIEWVESVGSALIEYGVDLYIGSFPIGGGRATLEAMSAGIPIVTHRHSVFPMLGAVGLGPHGTWSWETVEELVGILRSVTPETLSEHSLAVRKHYLKMHAPENFASVIRGDATVQPTSAMPQVADHLSGYLLRSQVRSETFQMVFDLLDASPGDEHPAACETTQTITGTTTDLLHHARALIAKRDHLAANEVLMRAIEAEPDNAFVLFELGRLAFYGKMPEEGKNILEEAATRSQAVLAQISELGETFLRDNDTENAQVILNLLRNIAEQSRASGSPAAGLTRIRALSDREWQEVLCTSHLNQDYHGFPMPGFPDEQFQIATMGCSNEMAMREAYRFYQSTLPFLARMRPLGERKYLDFGTGWGRFPRTFLKAVEPWNIHAIDVDPAMIDICKSTFDFGNFEVCGAVPPCSFADDTFDLITAYSVFSHLSEDAANRWMHEFARILRPGGIVAFTTQGSNFISLCAYFRMQQQVANPWHAQLATCFTDQEASYADYDAGKFLFAATGAGASEVRNASFYGEALIPAGYMIEKWGDIFDLLTFFHDQSILPQAFAVLRKK